MDLRSKNSSQDTTTEPTTEGSSPRHQLSLHSMWDFARRFELDPVLRYVSALPARSTSGYMELDVRLAWRPTTRMEISLVGQNLLHSHHPEFGTISELQRGFFGKVAWTW